MAAYKCKECGRWLDKDYHPPTENEPGELICDDCQFVLALRLEYLAMNERQRGHKSER